MGKNSTISISSLDAETVNIVKAKFLRYQAYKQLCDEFSDLDKPELEDFISYPSSANFTNDRVTSSPSLGGQPERDTLRYISKVEKGLNSKKKVMEMERALSSAITAAAKTAKPFYRDDLSEALYTHLCLGVPMKMLRSKISSPTLASYRDKAIVNAAINLGYISAEK